MEQEALWNDGRGFAAIRDRWLERAAGLGAPIAVKIGEDDCRGTFETIDDEGRLIVRTGDGPRARDQRRRSAFRRGRDGGALMAADELVFVALGGVGEIGMNLALYGYGRGRGRRWLAVDMGVAFGHEEVLPGVDARASGHPLSAGAEGGACGHRDHSCA